MRLHFEGFSGGPYTFPPANDHGGHPPSHDGGRWESLGYIMDDCFISPGEDSINAADVRRLWNRSPSERDAGEISQQVSGMQSEEMTSQGITYTNPSALHMSHVYQLAIARDSHLNPEERIEYDRVSAKLEYGDGFFRRAHP